jgi:hypothetical protein
MTPELWFLLGGLIIQMFISLGTVIGVWFALFTRVTRLEEKHQAQGVITNERIANLKEVLTERLKAMEVKIDDLLKGNNHLTVGGK